MQNDGVRFDGRGCAPFLPGGAEQDQRRVMAVDVDGHRTATGRADNDIGMMLVILGLGDPDGFIEIFVGQSWVEDGVAVGFEVGWFVATWDAGPAMEE